MIGGLLLSFFYCKYKESMAEEKVCDANRKAVERMYSAFLVENDIDHVDNIFNQFLIDNFDEICPASGVISYEYGKVKCSVHDLDISTLVVFV